MFLKPTQQHSADHAGAAVCDKPHTQRRPFVAHGGYECPGPEDALQMLIGPHTTAGGPQEGHCHVKTPHLTLDGQEPDQSERDEEILNQEEGKLSQVPWPDL